MWDALKRGWERSTCSILACALPPPFTKSSPVLWSSPTTWQTLMAETRIEADVRDSTATARNSRLMMKTSSGNKRSVYLAGWRRWPWAVWKLWDFIEFVIKPPTFLFFLFLESNKNVTVRPSLTILVCTFTAYLRYGTDPTRFVAYWHDNITLQHAVWWLALLSHSKKVLALNPVSGWDNQKCNQWVRLISVF